MNWKQFNRANNLMGWAIFAVATLTYLLTIGPSASLWDCAEFIACDYKLEIGHPPGAPFYMLVYNVISHLGGSPERAALMTNATSAVLSGLTILFLFWTITHMVRRVLTPRAHLGKQGFEPTGEVMTMGQAIAILGSGLVGSLVYTFSDSFWFSAVEAEVYAFSSLFTAVVFWLIFKWEERSEYERSDRWLVLIAYLMGLSIGVHLLNLLCLPAMALVYYYRRATTPTLKGSALALLGSFALVGLMMYGVVQGVPKLAGKWDMFFVNTCGLSYNQGLYIYLAVLVAVLIWGVYEADRAVQDPKLLGSHRFRISIALSLILMGIPLIGNGIVALALAAGIIAFFYLYKGLRARAVQTVQMSLVAIAMGFSSYGVILVRAVADPPMNENAPADAFSLRYYLAREQYGSAPLFYGPTFASPYKYGADGRPEFDEGEPTYGRVDKAQPSDPDRYVARAPKDEPVYEGSSMMLFPRVYDRGHAQMYNTWMGRAADDMSQPTFGDNLTYFFNYQLTYMYWRYFMWNFAGRQNDLQGDGGLLRGGAATGIPFVDSFFYGDSDTHPEDMTANKGHNVYYALPLILGLIGLFFQIGRGRRGVESFWVTFMLFFMPGIAIVLYLNQYPGQPRERDYAYVGSFYAFAIWVGFGVAAIATTASRYLSKQPAKKTSDEDAPVTISTAAAGVASLVLLLIPIQMAGQNWDDHARSQKYSAEFIGNAYLESVAKDKDAMIFTIGDNDTFLLWYAQEIEGYRTDVRVINTSLLQTDWYIDQMKRQAYNSSPIPAQIEHKNYAYGVREGIYFRKRTENRWNIKDFVNWVTSDDPNTQETRGEGEYKQTFYYYPTNKIRIPVNKENVLKSGIVKPEDADKIVDYIDITLPNAIDRARIVMLAILANNDWKRPIYFTGGSMDATEYIWMKDYLQLDGLVYKLVPIKTEIDKNHPYDMGRIDTDLMCNIVKKWTWGNMGKPNIYLDPETRKNSIIFRGNIARLTEKLIAEGKNAQAKEMLDIAMKNMPVEAYGY